MESQSAIACIQNGVEPCGFRLTFITYLLLAPYFGVIVLLFSRMNFEEIMGLQQRVGFMGSAKLTRGEKAYQLQKWKNQQMDLRMNEAKQVAFEAHSLKQTA